jgi:molybdopterin converting factor small subunit
MSVSVRIPTILRTYTDGASSVTVEPAEATLAGVLDALEAAAPGIRARVLDDDGKLRRFVNIYVDDDDVRFTDGLATPVRDGAHVSVIPAVAGG